MWHSEAAKSHYLLTGIEISAIPLLLAHSRPRSHIFCPCKNESLVFLASAMPDDTELK
jgi:hypothetical protein